VAQPDMTEEQAKQVEEARERFTTLKAGDPRLDEDGVRLLFSEARSQNGWQDRPVNEATLHELYEITRMGPTSMNSCPARILFLCSDEAKRKLKPTLMPANVDKVMAAPVVAVIGHDARFYDKLDTLFAHATDAPAMFAGNEELAAVTAFRNGTLQGAYLMIAARALGLDCGPMSGFDNAAVDDIFFAGTSTKSNFLCGLGYGNPEKLFQRLPRLTFEEACSIA